MRKITAMVVKSFIEGKAKSSGNTHTDGERLFLHGNLIAMKFKGGFRISSAGWRTVTTKERLNGLMSMINGPRINQVKGVWYQAGVPFTDDVYVSASEAV